MAFPHPSAVGNYGQFSATRVRGRLGGRQLLSECMQKSDECCAAAPGIKSVVSELDIFISSAVIALDRMNKLKNNAFVGHTGDFDNAINLAGSEVLESRKIDNTEPRKICFVYPEVTARSCWVHGLLISSMRKWRNCAFLLPVRRSHLQVQADFQFAVEDLEVFAQDNFSRCSRHVVSVVALLGLSIVFSVVMIPAPTSTPDDCLSSTSMRTDVLSIRGSSTCEVSLDICVCTDAAFNDDLMNVRCFYSFLPSCFPRVLYCGRSSWCSPIPCVVMDRRCGVSLPGSVLRDGYTHVMGLDVAASHWPAVEAATT